MNDGTEFNFATGKRSGSTGSSFLSNSSDVSGSISARTLNTAGDSSTGRGRVAATPSGAVSGSITGSYSPASQKKVRVICDTCLERLDSAINEEDPVLRSNSFEQFKEYLGDLWDGRDSHGDAYCETVNQLQSMLYGLDIDNFSEDQLCTLSNVMSAIRHEPEITDDIANDITESLIRAKFDVFRELL